MSKLHLSFIVFIMLLLVAGPAAAAPGDCPESSEAPLALMLNSQDEGWSVKPAMLDADDPGSSFLLMDQYECLNSCEAEYESCVNGAGDDVSKRFTCGEARFACTRSCDNAYYSIMEF